MAECLAATSSTFSVEFIPTVWRIQPILASTHTAVLGRSSEITYHSSNSAAISIIDGALAPAGDHASVSVSTTSRRPAPTAVMLRHSGSTAPSQGGSAWDRERYSSAPDFAIGFRSS